MIRLFAPPTSDAVLGRNAVTAGNLLLHVLALLLLAVPVERAVKQGLFDRLVVYLVPPDAPGGGRQGDDAAPLAVVALRGGVPQGAAVPETQAPEPGIQPRGDV